MYVGVHVHAGGGGGGVLGVPIYSGVHMFIRVRVRGFLVCKRLCSQGGSSVGFFVYVPWQALISRS